jgi:DNA replication protein DnaC
MIFGRLIAATICGNECREAIIDKKKMDERLAWWKSKVPKNFLTTQEDHPDMPEGLQMDNIMQWEGPQGLVIHGESGTCKTRCLFLLLKRVFMVDRQPVKWFLPGELEFAMTSAYTENLYPEFVKFLSSCKNLAFDDLGKDPISERMGSLLFNIINNRCNEGLPFFITTNFVGDKLINRFKDPDTGAPLVRRLREYCKAVHLKNKA